MLNRVTILEKTSRGAAFILDERPLMSKIQRNADDAEYRDQEDTNQFFLFATGEMAQLGHVILKEPRPFDVVTEDIARDPTRAGVWTFPTETALRAAYAGITSTRHMGTAFMLHVDRVQQKATAA